MNDNDRRSHYRPLSHDALVAIVVELLDERDRIAVDAGEAKGRALAAEVETKRLALALRQLIDASERSGLHCFDCTACPGPSVDHYDGCAVQAARSALRLVDYEDGGWAAVEVLPKEDDPIQKVLLTCKTCGHWKKGPLPQSVINNWLRVHLCAGLHNATDLEIVSESSCPNPCGSPPRGGTDRLETS